MGRAEVDVEERSPRGPHGVAAVAALMAVREGVVELKELTEAGWVGVAAAVNTTPCMTQTVAHDSRSLAIADVAAGGGKDSQDTHDA